jgi:hypothetical protein
VQPTEGRELEYNSFRDENVTWFTTGAVVKITDFGLSRIRLDNKRIICDTKNNVFNSQQDVDQVIIFCLPARDFLLIHLSDIPRVWHYQGPVEYLGYHY